ncbi:MAG: VWA domain-containing protein [Acidobacteriota bacterium]|nr:VWA domain-containing protein [Acidobacteriota bacterium]
MSSDMKRLAVCVLLVTTFVPLPAQQPTFRSGVDLVTLDATVLGRDGAPIDNLGPDDFRLEVDGRVRRVVSAQYVSQVARRTLPPQLAARHFTSNEAADTGRIIVVAVDEAHIRRLEGRPALRAAEAFIDKLDPSDHIGVLGLTRVGALTLTRNRVALKQKLGTLFGQADPVFLQFNLGLSEALEIAEGSRSRLADAVLRECGRALTEYVSVARAADDAGAGRDGCPEQIEQESRGIAQHAHTQARISLSGLEALVASLKDIPGPKTVVLLSEGMVADPRRIDLARVAAEAQAARVSIYALHLEVPIFEAAQDRISPTLSRDLQVKGDGLARVAGAARGAVFRLAGNDPRPFARIARELSGYYLLAFEPIETERDGRSHRIRVELARGGGELRARTGFTLPVVAPAAQSRDARLVTLLRTLTMATELPVRVATYAFTEPDSPRVRVVVSAEVDATALLGFVLIDARGVIATTAAREAGAGRYAFSAIVAPGLYTLRAGAIDPLGRQGSVERPFDARVTVAERVSLSDLILAPLPARPGDALEPFVDRVGGSQVMAYLEMHASERERLPDAVRIVITRADGEDALMTVAADVTRKPASSWAVARAVVPTGSMQPGRYVARAEIVTSGRTIARVPRPFTIPER